MATEELKVKFTVDASGVKTGADEAKNKVKQTASEMESDVKHSSDSMESHLDKVSESAQNIGEAASDATGGVQDLEQQVVQSSTKMEDSLDKVAEKVKGISAKQGIGIASRAFGVASNIAGWMGENYAEDEGSKAGWETASSALSGAAQGAMLGGAIGTIFGPVGTVIGGAAGALAGAAASLWASSKELEKAAKDLERSSEDKLLNAGKDLYERNRLTEYNKESEQFIHDLETGDRSTGDVYIEQQKRQDWLNQKIAERDQFVSEHQYDSGEAAVNSATKLDLLERAIQVAQERIAAFTPVVQAAQEIEQEGIREAQAAVEERKKEAQAARKLAEEQEKAAQKIKEAAEKEAAAKAAAAEKALRKQQEDQLKDEKRMAEKTLSETQRQLEGVMSKPANSPTDSLTRIGGGRGYTDYNNSTAKVQMSIEANLKTLVSNQQRQLQEIINKMDSFSVNGTWSE